MCARLSTSRLSSALTFVGMSLASAAATPLGAQTTFQPGESEDHPRVSLWLGGESVPASVDHTCWEPTGRHGMAVVGASLVVPVGPIGLEGRVGRHGSSSGECSTLSEEPLRQPGTYAERTPQLLSGGFTALDLRLRWSPWNAGAWFVAAGAGWAASSKNVPYLSASLGGGGAAGSVYLGAQLDLSVYRVPWTERTVEVTQTSTIETVRRSFEEWAPTFGMRLTIAIPMSDER